MDIFLFRRYKIKFAAIIMALCCVNMVAFPDIALSSARSAITLWMGSLLPALLPFFICSNFLQYIGAMNCFGRSVVPFVMSVLSGYPMGGKVIGDMKRSGDITLEEAKTLISYCNTSGPSFIIGAVGTSMLGSSLYGIIIAAAHYLGALLNGVIYRGVIGRQERGGTGNLKGHSQTTIKRAHIKKWFSKGLHIGTVSTKPSAHKYSSSRHTSLSRHSSPSRHPHPSTTQTPSRPQVGLQEAFSDAIISAFKSLGIILAYIVLFTFAIDMMYRLDIFNLIGSEHLRSLIKGALEMTVGCEAVAGTEEGAIITKVVLCSTIMSWGGLSVLGQVCSMMSGTGVRLVYIILTKVTHALIAALIAFIISSLVLL